MDTLGDFAPLGIDILRQILAQLSVKEWRNFVRVCKVVREASRPLAFDLELRHFRAMESRGICLWSHSYYQNHRCQICAPRFKKYHPTWFHRCHGCMEFGHSRAKCPNRRADGCEICGYKDHIAKGHPCTNCRGRGHADSKCKKIPQRIHLPLIGTIWPPEVESGEAVGMVKQMAFSLHPKTYQPCGSGPRFQGPGKTLAALSVAMEFSARAKYSLPLADLKLMVDFDGDAD